MCVYIIQYISYKSIVRPMSKFNDIEMIFFVTIPQFSPQITYSIQLW